MSQPDKAMKRERSRSPMGNAQRNGKGERPDKFGRKASLKQVCVANIPYDMTWQEVKDLFREKVGDVTFVRLFEDDKGRSKGMGLIEFAQPASVSKALKEMHRYEINGRRLVVKEDYEVERDRQGKAVPGRFRNDMNHGPPPGMRRGPSPNRFHGPPDYHWTDDRDFGRGPPPPERPVYNTYGLSEEFLASLNINGPLINRVFISNIDYNVSEKKLKDVFKLAGKIENIDFMTNNDGTSRGRAVIEYEHPVEAVQAISMLHQQKLFERVLSVELDKFHKNDSNRSFDSLPGGLKGVGRGLGFHGKPLNVSNAIGQGNSFQPPNPDGPVGGFMNNPGPDHGAMPASNSALGPASVLSTLSQPQLLALISSGLLTGAGAANVGAAANVVAAAPGPSNVGLGTPLIGQMPRSNNLNTSGNPLVGGIPMDPPKPILNAAGVSNMGGSLGGVPVGSNYDALPSSYDSLGSGYNDDGDKRLSLKDNFNGSNSGARYDTVAVRNLPQHFTWERLRDKFNEVGDVTFADIRNRGSGIVRFATPRDAERAVNLLNGARINGRNIDVQVYDLSR